MSLYNDIQIISDAIEIEFSMNNISFIIVSLIVFFFSIVDHSLT